MKNVFKLKDYFSICAAYLAAHSSGNAQVIYTDIIPDDTLDYDGEGYSIDIYSIDMDSDALEDFVFINFVDTDHYYLGFFGVTIERIWVGAWDTFANGIVADRNLIILSDTYYLYYPFALSQSYVIDSNLIFEGNGYQRMAARAHRLDSLNFYSGYWFPEVYDHYLGIRFKDNLERMHYGWIRCTVQDSGSTLIVKDYAYELQPNHPILAGDTVSYVPVQEHENSATISVYSFDNKVIINTSENVGNEIRITVFDSTGKKIRKVKSNQQHTEITLNVPQGIYAVEVTSEGNTFVKKVFLK